MIFEEINFLARNSFKSVSEAEIYRDNLENQLHVLKGKREILWRKHKSADENEKTDIFKEIKELTDKIDTIQSQKRACNGIIARYEEIKEKSKELIIADKKNKKLRNR